MTENTDQLKRNPGQLQPESLVSSQRNSWSDEPEFALRSQLKASKERISVLESFIDFKGLFEELTEFLKPKSVMEKLQKEKDKVANYKRKEPGSTEKKHDIAM